jgi:hypothetical protein
VLVYKLIDYSSKEFVMVDKTHPDKGKYHGHVVTWKELGRLKGAQNAHQIWHD